MRGNPFEFHRHRDTVARIAALLAFLKAHAANDGNEDVSRGVAELERELGALFGNAGPNDD